MPELGVCLYIAEFLKRKQFKAGGLMWVVHIVVLGRQSLLGVGGSRAVCWSFSVWWQSYFIPLIFIYFFSPLFLFYIPELYSQVGPPLSSRASFRYWIPEDSWTDVQVSWTRLKNQSSLLCSSVLKKMFWLQKGQRLMFYFLPLKQTVSSVSRDKFRKCFS